MKPDYQNNFANSDKQRELLLSGNFNNLFNELSLNLPVRFFSYAKPESFNPFFNKLFENLEKNKTKVNNVDAWDFDNILKHISPFHNFANSTDTLNFLIHVCRIPEKHIFFKENSKEEQLLFSTSKIYLTRYALCLASNHLLSESESFTKDMNKDLFVSEPDKEKIYFESEMAAAFAGYYFSHPETDIQDMIDVTWTWIRGKRLKNTYESAMDNLELIFHGIHGKKFSYHKLEEFKQNFIFDTLFKQPFVGTFKQQYENALTEFGYKLSDTENDIKWRKGKKVAPKYPGGFFAPHITFLIAWSVKKLCEFEQQEFNFEIKDRSAWFNNLTKNFFNVIKEGLQAERYKNLKTDNDFSNSVLFVRQHHSEAYKVINSIKHGTGKTKLDKKSGDKLHENPGALEFWKQKNFFEEDEIVCINFRNYAEEKLKKLYDSYEKKPSGYLIKNILEQEKIIQDECINIYNINFQGFIKLPKIIQSDGTLSDRNIFISNTFINDLNISKDYLKKLKYESVSDTQCSIDFNEPYYIDPIKIKSKSNFVKIPDNEINIKYGQPVSRYSFKNYKNELIESFQFDNDGIYQTVNPLKENPTVLKKSGTPKLVRENFEMHNFLFESDNLPLKEQFQIAKKLVSINAINKVVFSGNKSLHMIITVKDAPKDSDEYKWLFFYLGMKFGLVTRIWNSKSCRFKYSGNIDLSLCNNNRSMRRANSYRIINESKIKQKLLHQTNDILDLNWRPIYEQEMDWIKINQESVQINNYVSQNKDINKFILSYFNKNLLPLHFEKGNGHNTGCIIIGAAKAAGFNDEVIEQWLREHCNRFNELKNGWAGLLKIRSYARY